MTTPKHAAPEGAYPPLPDFDTIEQHIYGACRRYITQDMVEPIHNLMRDYLDAALQSKQQAEGAVDRSQPVGAGMTDAQLANAAYAGYDNYWTEDCKGIDAEAWAASAKAVIALSVAASAPAGERRLRTALEDIAAMTYDAWSNGARAGEIARNALASLPVSGDGKEGQ